MIIQQFPQIFFVNILEMLHFLDQINFNKVPLEADRAFIVGVILSVWVMKIFWNPNSRKLNQSIEDNASVA